MLIGEGRGAHSARLTLLAPDLVEAILSGRQPGAQQLHLLLRPFPVDWESQRKLLAAL
jgi:hypothetical protein